MFFDSFSKDIVATILATGILITIYYKWSFKYWQKKRVPFLGPTFPFGNMENPFSRKHSLGAIMQKYYNTFKSQGHKHGGLYNFSVPIYLPIAPEYVKNIIQKDFEYFVDRGHYYNERDDPLSAHLFAIGGQKWRVLRTKLTPTFTSGKMRMMFDTLMKASVQMIETMDKYCENKQDIDIKDVTARLTMDTIGTCAFGLECNSFRDSDAEFRKHGKNILKPHSKLKAIKHIFANAKPELGQLLGIVLLPRVSTDFFFSVIQETMKFRKEHNIIRNDMLQLLINIKNGKEKGTGNTLTTEEIAAQAMVFFLAGFETSSTTMSYCLYELSANQEIQDKVRKELRHVLAKYDGKITYDSLTEMKYLGQVIDETLRKYPALPFITRKCVINYKIPETDTVIEKGTLVFVPILGLHRDPEFFPDPEKFDPERFAEENKQMIRPFTYLPFGEGPRACIGLRFGMMQTKVGLAVLLTNYKFSLSHKTKIPLGIHPYTIILSTNEDILLNSECVI